MISVVSPPTPVVQRSSRGMRRVGLHGHQEAEQLSSGRYVVTRSRSKNRRGSLRIVQILLIEGRNYSPSKFIEQIKMDFDQLYDEAAHRRRMMSVSAHDRISASPQMVRAWSEFLRYAKGQPGVAFLRKDEIARYALESQLTLRESETI